MNSGQPSSPLEVFRQPVREFLKTSISEMGHDSSLLEPIIERSIDVAIRELEEEIQTMRMNLRPERFVRKDLEEVSLNYIRAVLSQEKKMNTLGELIRSYGSVFVVGAGISFESGVPLISHLSTLLKFIQLEKFTDLPNNPDKALIFKNQFKSSCSNKKPSASHRSIAEHFPSKIWEIICLNWDNFIEIAMKEIGKPVPKIVEEVETVPGVNYIWKPHGDVEKISKDNVVGKGGWVFPFQGGYIFECFIEYANKSEGLNSKVFILVIAGYSEGDKEIFDRVIGVLATNRTVYRIVLDLKFLNQEGYIVGPSDFVLPKSLA